MNFKDIQQAYFLGIGGIGMSAIARYFHSIGIVVNGYDKTETPLTKELVAEGIHIHYKDLGSRIGDLGLTKESCLVVLTPAIPKDHQEWKWLVDKNFTILKRSQVLGIITDVYQTIGVAGTHGKTTTSTLIAHILKQSNVDCAAFLGGISSNYQTNLLLNQSTNQPINQYMVVEADEFDRSFLTLHPSIAIITSTDADHLDIYGEHNELKKSFLAYASQCKENGSLILKKGLDITADVTRDFITYSVTEKADAYASNIQIKGDEYSFDLLFKEQHINNLVLGIPGLHNVENAVAASVACLLAGVTADELKAGLASFKGVKRRFEYIIKRNDFVYIDDYAHHPEELRAIISSVKNMYPNKKIVAAFQPHLFSRTRDFVDGFAESLSLLDNVVLLDIYPARELPMEGVTSNIIFDKMTSTNKILCSKTEAVELIKQQKPEVLLTLGAGDIDQLVGVLKEAYK
ncbi:UDP-N-acetylmuramate--alanine ligase [Bacteroidetes bacterium UKL13-3]|jgi:UDP-N-acetylmuramate--alanine ligase|nr:UDP-N-acetylmuramate--alanine ligase [Bacteroidetes bacterium UKL13-3]HCP92910.1 UDP-N-acetylmuramate--L-alanine ligase [Bacteroidota bacterium]